MTPVTKGLQPLTSTGPCLTPCQILTGQLGEHSTTCCCWMQRGSRSPHRFLLLLCPCGLHCASSALHHGKSRGAKFRYSHQSYLPSFPSDMWSLNTVLPSAPGLLSSPQLYLCDAVIEWTLSHI